MTRIQITITISIAIVLCLVRRVHTFSPPTLGLGALFFPVRNLEIEPANDREFLLQIADFFVDAFWTGKVGGGARELGQRQRESLLMQQYAEFNKRYGGKKRNAVLLVGTAANNKDVAACAGIEISRIPEQDLRGPTLVQAAPIMSNLAVGKAYRRRGVAEALVKAIEEYVQDEWGFDECFLYVERRNGGAVKLYRKLGYKPIWQDNMASTLLPNDDGSLRNSPTCLICMRKDLKRSGWFNIF